MTLIHALVVGLGNNLWRCMHCRPTFYWAVWYESTVRKITIPEQSTPVDPSWQRHLQSDVCNPQFWQVALHTDTYTEQNYYDFYLCF